MPKGYHAPKDPNVSRPCSQCGQAFIARDHTGTRTLCSRKCVNDQRSRHNTNHHAGRVCISCDVPLPPYEYPRRGVPMRACIPCALKRKQALKGAIRRGAKVVGEVYPIAVFIAANWHCQRCGCETPRALMGTNLANSPELDHKIPISRGGQHAADNVQLLCRHCNMEKARGEGPTQTEAAA